NSERQKLRGLPKGSPRLQEIVAFQPMTSGFLLGRRRVRLRRSGLMLSRMLFALAVWRHRRSCVMVLTTTCSWQRHRRDRVLEDQLLLRSRFKNDRVLVETFDPPRKLDPTHQVDRDAAAILSGAVKEVVLYCVLLLWCFFHCASLPWQKFRVTSS